MVGKSQTENESTGWRTAISFVDPSTEGFHPAFKKQIIYK